MTRTKIIATIGPATEKPESINKLVKAGASLFRFNLKYNTQKWHSERITEIKKMSKKTGVFLGTIVDIPRSDYRLEFEDFDFLALSYLKTADEIIKLKNKYPLTPVIAKIENRTAYNNIKEIIGVADAVMVARGDLAKEIDFPELAWMQKQIIDQCRLLSKPVIVATEMLMSMVSNSTPTRAEATDVANAVFDGADILMLSQETAMGQYPTEAVNTMEKIINYCENTDELRKVAWEEKQNNKIIEASYLIANTDKSIEKVIVFTKSGKSAREFATYRLKKEIVAVTDEMMTFKRLHLSYGIKGYLISKGSMDKFDLDGQLFDKIKKCFGWKKKYNCVIIHGNNWIKEGSTNSLTVKTI